MLHIHDPHAYIWQLAVSRRVKRMALTPWNLVLRHDDVTDSESGNPECTARCARLSGASHNSTHHGSHHASQPAVLTVTVHFQPTCPTYPGPGRRGGLGEATAKRQRVHRT